MPIVPSSFADRRDSRRRAHSRPAECGWRQALSSKGTRKPDSRILLPFIGQKKCMQRVETDPTERSMRQFLSACPGGCLLAATAMKKVLWSSVVAIMLIAALTAVAFAVDVSGPDTVEPGQTVTITVTGEGAATSGFVSVKGLRITDASGGFSTPDDVLLVDSHGGLTATYECVVTAEAGDSVAFDVTGISVSDGTTDVSAPNAGWSAKVSGAAEPTVTPEPDEPSKAPETETPAPPTQAPSTQPPSDEPSPTDDQGQQTEQPTDGSEPPAAAGDQSASPSASPSAKSNAEHLPKTADSSMDLWTYLVIGAGLAVVIVIAGKKVYARL